MDVVTAAGPADEEGQERIVGILDWEFARPADPKLDIAWVLAKSKQLSDDYRRSVLIASTVGGSGRTHDT
ncbi:phosphotransferase [Acrocarpospora catenulata]|uniref:phosphotransferase n=1 Tax=Acrocarpospora catenulata TaxID=2836182 RepID=UPI001BD91C7C|nr:phosphotransferase [Acrocarpospora catenulata]